MKSRSTVNPSLREILKMTGTSLSPKKSKIHLRASQLIGKTPNTLTIRMTRNPKDGMTSLKKLLIPMPPNPQIGMMNSMVTGKPRSFLTLNSRDLGIQNKSKILNTKESGFIL